jgi:hypothetical protein
MGYGRGEMGLEDGVRVGLCEWFDATATSDVLIRQISEERVPDLSSASEQGQREAPHPSPHPSHTSGRFRHGPFSPIRLSGATARNICAAGIWVSVLYLKPQLIDSTCSLTCHAPLRIDNLSSIPLGTWNFFLVRLRGPWLTSVNRVSLIAQSKLPGCSCYPPSFPPLSYHFFLEATARLFRLGI